MLVSTSAIKNFVDGKLKLPIAEIVEQSNVVESQSCVFCSKFSKQYRQKQKIYQFNTNFNYKSDWYYVECIICKTISCFECINSICKLMKKMVIIETMFGTNLFVII